MSGIVSVYRKGTHRMKTTPTQPTFNPKDPEEMGKHIVAYLHMLFVQNRQHEDGEPKQIFYDREEIRHAMGIDSEDDFIEGLIWAEKKGWITAQHDIQRYLQ